MNRGDPHGSEIRLVRFTLLLEEVEPTQARKRRG